MAACHQRALYSIETVKNYATIYDVLLFMDINNCKITDRCVWFCSIYMLNYGDTLRINIFNLHLVKKSVLE